MHHVASLSEQEIRARAELYLSARSGAAASKASRNNSSPVQIKSQHLHRNWFEIRRWALRKALLLLICCCAKHTNIVFLWGATSSNNGASSRKSEGLRRKTGILSNIAFEGIWIIHFSSSKIVKYSCVAFGSGVLGMMVSIILPVFSSLNDLISEGLRSEQLVQTKVDFCHLGTSSELKGLQ